GSSSGGDEDPRHDLRDRSQREGRFALLRKETMISRSTPLILALLATACREAPSQTPSPPPREALRYPAARRVDVKDVRFGVEVADPYRWLEDEKSPEVTAWMKAQGELARRLLD